jgi:hypothetical protein
MIWSQKAVVRRAAVNVAVFGQWDQTGTVVRRAAVNVAVLGK